jgi:hypothetical protein
MSLATTASVVAIAGGVNSLTGGGITNALGLGPNTSGTVNQANPMAPYQAQLAGMYAGYLQPGQSPNIQQMPGYTQFQQGVLDPALAANKASAASSGMLYSGNEAAALQNLGQNQYSAFMNNYMSQLSGGAGVGFNPASAAQLGVQQANLGNQGIAQGFGNVATNLRNFGGGATGSTGAITDPNSQAYFASQAAGLPNTGEMGLVY